MSTNDPEIEGLRWVLRMRKTTETRLRIELAEARRELAGLQLERAQLDHYLADADSRGISVPGGLYPRHFKKFFEGE